MRRRTAILSARHAVAALLAVSPIVSSCSSSGPASTRTTRVRRRPLARRRRLTSPGAAGNYTPFWTVENEPVGGAEITLDVPREWGHTVDALGSPSFDDDGLSHGPDIVLLPSSGTDAKARIEALIHRQYDDEALATAEREDGTDGQSVWMANTRSDGYIDARRFLAAPGDTGVVVCVITLTPSEADRLAELKQICSTVQVTP